MLPRKAPLKFPTLPTTLAPVLLALASMLAMPALTAPSRAHGAAVIPWSGSPAVAGGAALAYRPDFAAFRSRHFDFHSLLSFVGLRVGPAGAAFARAEAIVDATPPVGVVGKAYSYDLATHLSPPASGKALDPRDATWTVASGQLPSGLLLSPDGVISGTPEAAARVTLRIQALYVTDAGVRSYEFEMRLTVVGAKRAVGEVFPAV